MDNKNRKQMLKDLKKRITAFGLATTMATMGGCSDKIEQNIVEPKKEEIGYLIEGTDYSSGLYKYVLNINALESEVYDFENTKNGIRIAKVIDQEEYKNSSFDKSMLSNYTEYAKMVIPDSYSLFTNYDDSKDLSEFFECQIKCEKLRELSQENGNEYIVIYSSITANQDILLKEFAGTIPKDDFTKKTIIKEGENITSIAMYYDNELVGYKQTGVGSECQNVIGCIIGDIDSVISTVEETNLLTETKTISYDDLFEIQNELNINVKLVKLIFIEYMYFIQYSFFVLKLTS